MKLKFSPYQKKARPRLLKRTFVGDHDFPQSDIGLEKFCSPEKETTFVSNNIEGTGALYPLEEGNSKTDQPSLGDDLAAKQSGTLLGGNTEDDSCVIIGYSPGSDKTDQSSLGDDFADKLSGTLVGGNNDDDSCVFIGYSPRRDKPSDLHNKDNGNSSRKDKGWNPKLIFESEKKETSSVSDGDATSGIADKKKPSWWSPCGTLDFLFTHSEVDESNKKYRTWSELDTSEGKASSFPPRESYIPTDQAWWYAQNVIATGRDIIYRPLVDEWKERMDGWSQLMRLINESETRRLVPTEEYPTHVCEWLARVDFRHECVRQKIDYTRHRPKRLREKPGFCARHRPYVRKTRNHREAFANVGRMDLNRVQFIDNF
ncbi:uncharacterized protein LOC133202866 [Saccostrea echinata]|uniref:uncharacterized protein LOC133202866 n=1 Tax=Saccostrea echinata TaxID=191078 RepID=UPI002A8019FE|nr:uncharacterized protein LOC133202866 [Saccostrea echinata]